MVAILSEAPLTFLQGRPIQTVTYVNVITQLSFARDLTDIYALSFGCCIPLGIVRIYQSNPSWLYYYIYIRIYTCVCVCVCVCETKLLIKHEMKLSPLLPLRLGTKYFISCIPLSKAML